MPPRIGKCAICYLIEAIPRSTVFASGALHSKTIVMWTSEMWVRGPTSTNMIGKGELWQSPDLFWLAFRRSSGFPHAKVAIYPFKRSFVVAAVSTDVQIGQATPCYLPGRETPER